MAGYLYIYPPWNLLHFLNLRLNVFHQSWELYCHCLLEYYCALTIPHFLQSTVAISVLNVLVLHGYFLHISLKFGDPTFFCQEH